MIGLEKFRASFADYTDNYVVIGGIACGIYAEMNAQPIRVTHDIDTILVVEALSRPFVERFWQLVKDAGYSKQENSQGKHEHFRFSEPTDKTYPEQIELFSRDVGILSVPEDARLTPIPTDDDVSSLSAILMEPEYYHYTIAHSELVTGVHIARQESLICLKCKAYNDLTNRKMKGETIDSRKITKHKRDVFRLILQLPAEAQFALPELLWVDVQEFVALVQIDMPNADMLKAIGAKGVSAETLLQRMKEMFIRDKV